MMVLFVGNGYDLKIVIIELVIGKWFCVVNVSVSGSVEVALLVGQVGGGWFLMFEELVLWIRDVMGFLWVILGGCNDSLLSMTKGYLMIYGGIDFKVII